MGNRRARRVPRSAWRKDLLDWNARNRVVLRPTAMGALGWKPDVNSRVVNI